MNKFLSLLLSLVLLLGSFVSVSAQVEPVATTEVNSFELFWPVSAGRTMGDSLYALKNFKEKLRGALIFGKPQKAEYAIFLATKRVVEAEKLLSDGKNDLASSTLDKMTEQLEIATVNADLAKGQFGEKVDEVNNKLDNLEIFLPWLATKYESAKGKLDPILEKVKLLNSSI